MLSSTSYSSPAKSDALPAARANLLRVLAHPRVHHRLAAAQAVKTDAVATEILKKDLINALEASKGDVKADGVSEMIAKLVERNPTDTPARNAAALTVRLQTKPHLETVPTVSFCCPLVDCRLCDVRCTKSHTVRCCGSKTVKLNTHTSCVGMQVTLRPFV